MHVKVAHLTHELDGLDRPLLVARRRRWKRSISDGIMMFSEDRWKHWMDTCTHDAQPLTHPSTTQQQTHRRSDAMAPIPSTLALSAKGGGGGRAIAITPRDAALLATGLLGGAFVVSHLYFLLKKRHASLCSFLRLLGLGGGLEGGMDPATGRLLYPKTARGSTVDVLHGVAVPDPYRWLEDPDARAVRAWVAAQNRTSDAYFGTLKDEKEKFRARMHELVSASACCMGWWGVADGWMHAPLDRLADLSLTTVPCYEHPQYHYDKYSCVWRKGDRYFFYKKAGLQNQSVLYTQVTAQPRTSHPAIPSCPSALFPFATNRAGLPGRGAPRAGGPQHAAGGRHRRPLLRAPERRRLQAGLHGGLQRLGLADHHGHVRACLSRD